MSCGTAITPTVTLLKEGEVPPDYNRTLTYCGLIGPLLTTAAAKSATPSREVALPSSCITDTQIRTDEQLVTLPGSGHRCRTHDGVVSRATIK